MYSFQEVDDYLHKLAYTEAYTALDQAEREKVVFTAHELLITYIAEPLITTKIIAMQVMCALKSNDGDLSAIDQLQKKGVKSYSLEDVSVTFAGSDSATYQSWWANYPGVCPDILALLAKQLNPSAYVGRLI
ncbi:hypothetical protein K7T73_12465 [Bacillus badius]|uniref:hypothetical protein n=1 Tax=Bacillus badius TaxID=1455 RepID=UPI001CBED930|nr:hypothetical protein [Bacillus badius]UAT29414.1 hypothetical protein K7T73_12465 [Bacillus badius]